MAASMALSSGLSWSNSISKPISERRLPAQQSISREPLLIVAQGKVKKTRQVILKENIQGVGKKDEMVKVRLGYFRNYLLPMGKAEIVTPLLLKEMKLEEERIEAEKQRVLEEARQLARVLETAGAFKVKRKGGGKGKLIFGTVTNQDVVDIIKSQLQRDIDKRVVTLPEIRETGEYVVFLKLHPDVTARVRLHVYSN